MERHTLAKWYSVVILSEQTRFKPGLHQIPPPLKKKNEINIYNYERSKFYFCIIIIFGNYLVLMSFQKVPNLTLYI